MARVEPARRFPVSAVWVIPLVAALIGLFVAARTWLEQGPTVTIEFPSGAGLEVGKTRIKYKDLDIGLITTLALSDDADGVVASAQLTRSANHLLVSDTRFWVVSARVTGTGVSGLGTLLAGAHVALDVGKSGEPARRFVALAAPPAVTLDVPGTSYVLSAESLGSVGVGTPIYFRRIEAGQVTDFTLDDDGKSLDIRIFVKSPYDRFVTERTRFWEVSGLQVTLGADGVEVNSESLTAMLAGGIAFEAIDGEDIAAGSSDAERRFQLFPNRTQAMRQPHGVVETYLLRFSESVRGLSLGAPVSFRGITVGEVRAINVDFDRGSGDLGVLVEVDLYPRLLEPRSDVPRLAVQPDSREVLDRMIARGLRAQLRNGNIVTGQLYVALDFFPRAPRDVADWTSAPPRLPTTKGSLEELQATLARVLHRLEKVPMEAIGQDVRATLAQLTQTLARIETLTARVDGELVGELQAALDAARTGLEEARGTFADGRAVLKPDSPLQQDVRETLHELARTAQALRALADTLERNPEALLQGKPEEPQ